TVDRAYRTFLGRLGNRVVKSDPRMSAFYFQVSDQQVFAVKFADEAGLFHIVSDTEMPEANQWYHLAAVSDGSTLKLYKDSLDGQGYRLVGKGDLTSSPNPAMANPPVDSNGDTWSWSVGFCKYGLSSDPKDDNVDRFLGCVDEIMISDTALTPDKFLFSQPNRKTAPAVARTDSPASQAEASSPAAPAEAAKPIWKSPILYIVVLSAIAVVVLLFVIIQLVFAVKRTVK
ncbi:MAG TPA: LamG domain-containing protein, partial [Candidatus Paceibacterota bacterium]|nr:LamG domain-containing protein [Candidatus Paceibacterota bacterium]